MDVAGKSLTESYFMSQARPEILMSDCEQMSKLDIDPHLEGLEELCNR